MHIQHQPVIFECEGEQLLGVIEHPENRKYELGVLIVTGGPQYRIGSHRQFVLIARALAMHGIPTMRFDYRGTGDSGGPPASFDQVSKDIKSAINSFAYHSSIQKVVLWGLCDAASACMIYGFQDPLVKSMILVNPWVRTSKGLADAYVKHYYIRKVLSQRFWMKVLSGQLSTIAAFRDFLKNLRMSQVAQMPNRLVESKQSEQIERDSFRQRMLQGVTETEGFILFILCGGDLTAAEFLGFVARRRPWKRLMNRRNVCQLRIRNADHTFSKETWRQEIIERTLNWISQLQK